MNYLSPPAAERIRKALEIVEREKKAWAIEGKETKDDTTKNVCMRGIIRLAAIHAEISSLLTTAEAEATPSAHGFGTPEQRQEVLDKIDAINDALVQQIMIPCNLPEGLEKLVLAEGFGDPMQLLNMRQWFQEACEAKGGKRKGGGIGMGAADLDIEIEGHMYHVSIQPIMRGGK